MSDMSKGLEQRHAVSSLVCAEEAAYQEIKRRILDGELRPGTRLVHRALARELEMSPIPVVPALRLLERDGLVTNTPGLGAQVRTWTRAEIIDLFQIRAFQEALACRLCAERAGPADIGAISAALARLKESFRAGDEEVNRNADMQFHQAIVRGAHCADLERNIESLALIRASMKVFSAVFSVPRFLFPGTEGDHDLIADAITRRDPDAAEQAGRRHVQASLERNLRWLDEHHVAVADGDSTGGERTDRRRSPASARH